MHQRDRSLTYRRIAFGSICVIYLALTFAYAILVPPWESPDEPAHYLYAAQLAERGRPPLQPPVRQRDSFCRDYVYISSNYHWYQPALGYLPAAVMHKALNLLAPRALPRMIPPLHPPFCVDPISHPNLFSHPNLKLFAVWKNIWGLLLIRLYLSVFGLATIYAVYRIGCACDPAGGWLGIVAAGWVAFLPQFTFINASVRSDTLTNAIAALIFLLAVWMQTAHPHTNKLAVAIGILLGLGLLSKHNLIYIAPVALLAVILANPRAPRAWLKSLLWVGIPAATILAMYYLAFDEARAALMYTLTTPSYKMRADLLTFDYVRDTIQLVFIDSFFARFGWMNISVPSSWARLAMGFWIVGTAIATKQVWQQRKNYPIIKPVLLLMIAIFLADSSLLLTVFRPQGRHLFTILAPWAVLCFWGWFQVLSTRGRMFITIAAPAFMLAFNLSALFFVLVPAYYK